MQLNIKDKDIKLLLLDKINNYIIKRNEELATDENIYYRIDTDKNNLFYNKYENFTSIGLGLNRNNDIYPFEIEFLKKFIDHFSNGESIEVKRRMLSDYETYMVEGTYYFKCNDKEADVNYRVFNVMLPLVENHNLNLKGRLKLK